MIRCAYVDVCFEQMETVEQLLKNETHPEILREIALFIHKQSQKIADENDRLKKMIAKTESEKQQWLTNSIRTELHKLRNRLFGRGRETLKNRDRRTKDEDLLLHAQSLAAKPSKEEVGDLSQEEKYHGMGVAEAIALAKEKDSQLSEENARVEEMPGFFEISTEITITERTYKKVIHKRQKSKVINTKTNKETIVTAPGPLKLMPGCRYSLDFALDVVGSKFMNHMPYERIRRDMKRRGLNVPVMTLYRLSEFVALHMEAVVEDIREDIFNAKLAAHLDETSWPILSNHDDDGQMWILSNQAGSYYRFEPTRAGWVADELLKGYKGSVLTDKYSGYVHFRDGPDLIWGLCWSHGRREFIDLKEAYPEEVTKVVAAIDDLFEIERRAQTWEDLSKLRKTESVQKLDEIKKLLYHIQSEFFDKDDLCRAANYILSAWKEFTAFVENVELPLSNNAAERALRHAVLGRKNYNGSKTINGADVAATLFSVIESCKKVELDPYHYMKYVIAENQSDRKPLTPLRYARSIREKK